MRMMKVLCVVLLAAGMSACGQKAADADLDAEGAAGHSVAVTLSTANAKEVRDELFSVGRVVSRNTPTLAAEINARVLEVRVDVGQPVALGQLLVVLDKTASELAEREAQAEIERLSVSIANGQRRVTRYRDLKSRDMMPQERLDDAEAMLAADRASLDAARARLAIARDRMSKTRLVSPVSGAVEKRHVSVGDYAQVGGPLITLSDAVNLRVEMPFPETVGQFLRAGQSLLLESPIAPGLRVEAVIGHIRPQVGALNRSLLVIADLVNPGNWRPEATVEGVLLVETRANAVVVPSLSVVRRPAGEVVYRVQPGERDHVEQVVVSTGVRFNGHVEIREGLKAGDLVVRDGAHYLTDGARISVQEETGE